MEADDGESALHTMRQEQTAGRNFDFIFMDYVMVIQIFNSYSFYSYYYLFN